MEQETQVTPYNLEKTLILDCLKLFAIVARFDKDVTDREREYVRQYLRILFSDDLTGALMERFNEYVAAKLDVREVVDKINREFSYENKIFFSLKIYELITNDEDFDQREADRADEIFKALHIDDRDVETVKRVYQNDRFTKSTFEHGGRVSTLVVGPDADESDLLAPYDDANLLFMKVDDLICIIDRSGESYTFIDDLRITGRFSLKVQQGQEIAIKNHLLKYDDLMLLFTLNMQALADKSLFIKESQEDVIVDAIFSKTSVGEIRFENLLIKVLPLSGEMKLEVNGELREDGAIVNLSDRVFVNDCDLNIRRIFVEYRLGREDYIVEADKDRYVVSNGPNSDIFVFDAVNDPWECYFNVEEGRLSLDPHNCPHDIYVNERVAKRVAEVKRNDYVFINDSIFHFDVDIIRKLIFSIKNIEAFHLRYVFNDKTVGVDQISFEVTKGDFIGIIGPSGSGKSTLLSIINGYNKPDKGEIFVNDFNLHKNYESIKDYIGYVPQDDLLFDNLTAEENLRYYAKLRYPEKDDAAIRTIVRRVLMDIEMHDKRHERVGSVLERRLSGGERKRLNIGLELVSDVGILFLDEPTSGLSSKDSEKIVGILHRLTLLGKIVFSVIHQPSAKVYRLFSKIILMDKGGKLAYFGEAMSALKYFHDHDAERRGAIETYGDEESDYDPDNLLDTLEEPIRDIDGSKLPYRRYTPDYWKERFKRRQETVKEARVIPEIPLPLPPKRQDNPRKEWTQFATLFIRNFKNKVRDKSNLFTTFLGAPVLALIVSFILRYNPYEDSYNLYQNSHLKTFIFLAVIISVFLALSNSVDEIVKDAGIRMREKILDIKHKNYYLAKFLTQAFFALVQTILFVAVSFPILEIHELYFHYVAYLTLVSLGGVAVGLSISSIPNLSEKAASNLVPVILIPQIIFGGALIEYEEMNRALKIVENDPIPEICQFMTSRWAYEGLMTMQYSYNAYHTPVKELEDRKDKIEKNKEAIIEAYGKDYYADLYVKTRDQLREFRQSRRDKYGNADVNKAVREANLEYERKRERSLMRGENIEANPVSYPLFVSEKRFPFTDYSVHTVWFNSMFVLAITVFHMFLALTTLHYKDEVSRAVQFLKRMRIPTRGVFSRGETKKRDA